MGDTVISHVVANPIAVILSVLIVAAWIGVIVVFWGQPLWQAASADEDTMPKRMLVALVQEAQQTGGAFGPEEIAVMTTVFENLLSYFKLSDRNDPTVRKIAQTIIELVREGERDPDRLRQRSIVRLSRS